MNIAVLLSFIFFATMSTAQAQTVFPACLLSPRGYTAQAVHCTDGRANCGNPQPIPYGEPLGGGNFFIVPKGQVVTLKTWSGGYQQQVQCVLHQNAFPALMIDVNRKVFAYKLDNGQEVYTKEGEPWDETSFTRLGLPVQTLHSDTFDFKK